jgi:Lon protease-like protein
VLRTRLEPCGQTDRIAFVSLLPLFPLDVVLFPGAPLPLHIFEPRYKELVAECMAHKTPFGMIRARENALAEVGCTAVILSVTKTYEDGRLDISTEGGQRFEIQQLNQERTFLRGNVVFLEDEPSQVSSSDNETVIQLHEQLFEVLGQPIEVEKSYPSLSFQLAHELPVDLDFKQTILEMKSEAERIETLIEYYRSTIPKVEKTMRARDKASGNGHVR